MSQKVDTTAIQFNQASIIVLTLLGFVFNQTWLALLVGIVLAVGVIWPAVGLFKLFYLKLIQPVGLLKANMIDGDPAPHRFAQGLGALFLLASSLTLLGLGNDVVGWVLAWIVIILASINLVFNFCAGCFVYYQLDKLGLLARLGLQRG